MQLWFQLERSFLCHLRFLSNMEWYRLHLLFRSDLEWGILHKLSSKHDLELWFFIMRMHSELLLQWCSVYHLHRRNDF